MIANKRPAMLLKNPMENVKGEGRAAATEREVGMKRNCHIVCSVTKDKETNQIIEFDLLNAFETEGQARASLCYEADLFVRENEIAAQWADDDTLLLPCGPNSRFETRLFIDGNVDFHDDNEPLMDGSGKAALYPA